VDVPVARVDEDGSCRIPDRRAVWVVTVIDRCRSRLNEHHTWTRVRMPAAVAARRVCVVYDIDIRRLFRDDLYLRVLTFRVGPAENPDVLEERSRNITQEILARRCRRGARPI